LQLSVGCIYADNGDVVKFEAGERLTELLSVVEESSHKVVVFVPFKHAIMAVKEFLESNEVTTECIYGDVPLAKRTEIFRSFQEEADPRVLVIQPQSAAHGVTLTAASTIVWFGPTPSVETYLQGNARIHRAGQTNKTLVVRLCGSPAERQVYKALDSKEADQTKLMALYEAVLKGE
jgi:SNF2 family DNA or RNA helicase